MNIDQLWDKLPAYWWSVDPGDVHVGISRWTGPVCFDCIYTNPDDAVDMLVSAIHHNGLQHLVYERFLLRGELMAQQQGSEFFTSQLIGAMRHICRRAGVPVTGYRPRDHKTLYNREEFRHPQRGPREWRSYGVGKGKHTKDSENCGEYHVWKLLRQGKGY